MIAVDRTAVPAPAVLSGPAAQMALEKARQHFGSGPSGVAQKRFEFDEVFKHGDVRDAIETLFRHKCAFCESDLGAATVGIVHHFRPTHEAVDRDGSVSWEHYWWLAYEWANIFLSCARCATRVNRRFPVDRRRAEPGTVGEALRDERPLLVDPTVDDPDEHIVFDDAGFAGAKTKRGEATISIFRLNRRQLVAARARHIESAVGETRLRLAVDPTDDLSAVLSADREYSAAIRQAVLRYVATAVPEALGRLTGSRGDGGRDAKLATPAEARRAVTRARAVPMQPVGIRRIRIRNFRAIAELDIEFADPQDDRTPWAMLLGENGYGKTSILQAVALALMGEAARASLRRPANEFVRHRTGLAEVHLELLDDELHPRTLRIREDTGRFEVEGDDTPAALAAYGASRIPTLQRAKGIPRRSRTRPRVESLFDSHTHLMPASRWLLSLDEREFEFAARALRQIVLAPPEAVIEQDPNSVVLVTSGIPVALEHLSDGYRSMIGLAVDLMSFMIKRFGSMDAAQGIVLVDELGAHLHPRWQMRVVSAFRSAFPRLQFIATTHDPLCLRGLEDDEVVVLRRAHDTVFALTREETPKIKGLHVDELLMSEIFGLSSTLDPEVEDLFDEYYALLAKPLRGGDDEPRIRELKRRLDIYEQRGMTRREKLAFDIADEALAKTDVTPDPVRREELSEGAREDLLKLWAE